MINLLIIDHSMQMENENINKFQTDDWLIIIFWTVEIQLKVPINYTISNQTEKVSYQCHKTQTGIVSGNNKISWQM